MKKKNRIIICILSAMILGSCLATPAFAAQPAQISEPGLMEDILETAPELSKMEESKIISQTTKQLSLTEDNMVQHEEVTTIYDDGTQVVVTLTAQSIPDSPYAANSWSTVKGTAVGKVYNDTKQKLFATITVNGEFRYDSANKLVERTSYNRTVSMNDPEAIMKKCDLSIDTGKNLNGTTWAYVRANYRVNKGFTNYTGYVELKCDSNGKVTQDQSQWHATT